jgi:hypothetical protein
MRPINEQLILSEAVGWRAVHQNEFYDSEKISRRSSIVDWKRANGQLFGIRRANFVDSNRADDVMHRDQSRPQVLDWRTLSVREFSLVESECGRKV